MNPEKEYQAVQASIAEVLGRRAPSGYDYTAHNLHIQKVLTAAGFGPEKEAQAAALESAADAAEVEELSTAKEVIYDLRARAAELRRKAT